MDAPRVMEACRLTICQDPVDLAARAAELVIACASEALRQRDRFTLVLCGGSTPEKTYALLAEPDRAAALKDVLEGNADQQRRPAAGIRPTDGTLAWLVDRSVAGLLKQRS